MTDLRIAEDQRAIISGKIDALLAMSRDEAGASLEEITERRDALGRTLSQLQQDIDKNFVPVLQRVIIRAEKPLEQRTVNQATVDRSLALKKWYHSDVVVPALEIADQALKKLGKDVALFLDRIEFENTQQTQRDQFFKAEESVRDGIEKEQTDPIKKIGKAFKDKKKKLVSKEKRMDFQEKKNEEESKDQLAQERVDEFLRPFVQGLTLDEEIQDQLLEVEFTEEEEREELYHLEVVTSREQLWDPLSLELEKVWKEHEESAEASMWSVEAHLTIAQLNVSLLEPNKVYTVVQSAPLAIAGKGTKNQVVRRGDDPNKVRLVQDTTNSTAPRTFLLGYKALLLPLFDSSDSADATQYRFSGCPIPQRSGATEEGGRKSIGGRRLKVPSLGSLLPQGGNPNRGPDDATSFHPNTIKVGIVMAHGGYFAGGVWDLLRQRWVVHKTISRYVVRKGQGGRQSAHGGRTDTAGSQIRAAQEKLYMEDIKAVLAEWHGKGELQECKVILHHTPGTLNTRTALLDSVLGSKDGTYKRRLCQVPITTGRPILAECEHVLATLCTICVGEEAK